MARHATIIDQVTDLWGDQWDVREWRKAASPDVPPVAIGWPSGMPRGKGSGGPRVIVTAALAAYCEANRHAPANMAALPIANTARKRVRHLLGHHWRVDRAVWWAERADDLVMMTIADFAVKHGVSVGAASIASSSLTGPRVREAGWWTDPKVATIIMDVPRAVAAEMLSVPPSSISRMRHCIMRATGDKKIGSTPLSDIIRLAGAGVELVTIAKKSGVSVQYVHQAIAAYREYASARGAGRPVESSGAPRNLRDAQATPHRDGGDDGNLDAAKRDDPSITS